MCGGGSDYTDKDKSSANSPENQSDEKIKDGPVKNRSCTDCLMCIFFIAFLAGFVIATAYGLSLGDPYKLITPIDYSGNG
jgi:hypothetical protein